jgi:hypothetical protein
MLAGFTLMRGPMTHRTPVLAALVVVGAACAGPAEEPQTAAQGPASEPSVVVQQPVTAAQATAGKPLVHVWKSPT